MEQVAKLMLVCVFCGVVGYALGRGFAVAAKNEERKP
jgi:hypothetical protein